MRPTKLISPTPAHLNPSLPGWRVTPSAARENYSQFYAAGITRSGASTFDAFTPMEYSDGTVTALVCLDISEVTLSNADGTSAVPPDRPPRQAIEVFYVSAETATRLAISSTTPTESIQCE